VGSHCYAVPRVFWVVTKLLLRYFMYFILFYFIIYAVQFLLKIFFQHISFE